MIQANFKLNDYGCTTNSNFLFCSLTYYMNDLNRNCLKSGHWVILHDTQYDTPQSLGQLGRGISYSYIIYSFMFHILQNQKMTTHKHSRKHFFFNKMRKEKKTGTGEFKFHTFIPRAHYKSCTHEIYDYCWFCHLHTTGRKYFFEGHCLFFKKKK